MKKAYIIKQTKINRCIICRLMISNKKYQGKSNIPHVFLKYSNIAHSLARTHRNRKYMKSWNFVGFSSILPDVSSFVLYTQFINIIEKL